MMGLQQEQERLLADITAEINKRLPPDDADAVIEFANQTYRGCSPHDFADREASDMGSATLASWQFIQSFKDAVSKVRIFTPEYKKHGWHLSHTVVSIHCRNMPFVTDSIRGELNRRGLTIHIIHSTILSTIRDTDNRLKELLPARSVMKPEDGYHFSEEVLLYFEIGRCTNEHEITDIRMALEGIIGEVAFAVDDFPNVLAKVKSTIGFLQHSSVAEPEKKEATAFLDWIHEGQFTFLGYEHLKVDYQNGEANVERVSGSELGHLKQRGSSGVIDLQRAINTNTPQQLHQSIVFSKSSLRSRVHRLVYPDYVLVRIFDDKGRISDEHRFMGLYTSRVYTMRPGLIPIIRGKVVDVLDRSGLDPKTHEGKDLVRLLDIFPRDELFQSSVSELFATAMNVNRIQERRQVRLFVRYDVARKFVNCLVYVPRDIYRTELRKKIQDLLCNAFGAEESEFTTFFSESVLTRTHFVLRVNPVHEIKVKIATLEEEVVKVTMSWKEYFKKYLIEEFGEEQGGQLVDNYIDAFSPGYMDDFEPRAAIDDINKISSLNDSNDIAMTFYRRLDESEQSMRFRLFHLDTALSLSDVMPVLEHLGLRVESEHPYGIKRKDGKNIWIHEFSLTYGLNVEINFDKVSENFREAFRRIWMGDAESDAFNRLIIGASLGWRQIAMLRAYARYMKQIRFNFSDHYIADTLCNHLDITEKIVEFFNLRFGTECLQGSNGDDELSKEEQTEQFIIECLDNVENLNEDNIIRSYLALIKATLRTNYFQRNSGDELKNYFSFKLSPNQIPDIPLPIPMYEIFVYSPRVEGVHLRGGKVARGGLRWSDRQEDFRTEVLGLVKAQQVKNAVIVPTGAKGGFVAKQLPVDGDREAIQQEGINCYKIFIQGLLDVTDNLIDGKIIPPSEVVRKDDDDSYLVVAADKGTATFSDIANQLAINSGFWLGDAFASGGSAGYDHKKMGITAKGAWVSVQRHFREIGINVQETDFTVVGVGDMGGDVFGNGMLLSEHIQLVCAFNHMHIFVDPDPDAATSFIERKRLFEMPRSSWDDYNRELISKGGGIFRRAAKSIAITPEMKERFDITEDSMTPTNFIHSVLKAPVDLLWNGGIGTYIKSAQETHGDVGDKANDSLRVNGNELRCKVVGEGGNLGVTQLGRVEFALNGGHINTDFIDNAAGVDCSDHEVNIKILLNGVVASDDMTGKQRNQLLEQMTDTVSDLVLENNYKQTQALSLAEREAFMRLAEYRRLIQDMESAGKLNRQLEFLPADDELQERRGSAKGLTRPELSVLISYVKSQLKEELIDTTVPNDEFMANAVETAFPQRLRDDFKALIHDHRLRREIISTQLANDMINHMGITFVGRMEQSTGVSKADIVSGYVTAREVFDMPSIWDQVEALDYQVSSELQMEMMAALNRLIRRASRWFIRNRRGEIHPASEIANFRDSVRDLRAQLGAITSGKTKETYEQAFDQYTEQGVPKELASYIASVRELYPFLSIIDAAQTIDAPVNKVAQLFFSLAERLQLDWFAAQISDLKIENHWQAIARESYRDDLEWQMRNLTVGAMRHICEKGDIEACIDRWMEQQNLLVERWQEMLANLQATETQEFAMFSVAIRELLDLAQSSKYGEVA